TQHRQLDRVELVQCQVQAGRQGLVDLALDRRDPMQDLAEIGAIDIGEIVVDPELSLDLVQRMLGHVPLVQRLGRELAGFAALGALRWLDRIRRAWLPRAESFALVPNHLASNCASRLTISRADRAASAPLLQALVPERSMACSMESTVRTPKATGTPNSMDTWARPLVHSPATYSKCGVPPRITAPRATIAEYSPCWATFCATSGISKAPGARMMVMSL